MTQAYDPGNYAKYASRNPLKQKVVSRLNARIILQLKSMLSALHSRSPKQKIKILDAGCGEGFIDRLILDLITPPDTSLTGLEYTREALEIARQMNPEVTYIQGDITAMPFADKSFDIVICTEVLEHLEKPELAIKEIARVCKTDILLTVPHEPWFCLCNLATLHNILTLGNTPGHLNHWTISSLRHFCKQHTQCIDWQFTSSFPWTMAKGKIMKHN